MSATDPADSLVGTDVEVEECPGGPLLVRGASAVLDAEGTPWPVTRPVVAVCRCTRSERMPWCDSSHKRPPRRS